MQILRMKNMSMCIDDGTKKKTMHTYITALGVKSTATQKVFQCVVNNIREFGKLDLENIHRQDEESIYDTLQQWIIWNNERGLASSSMKCYFNFIRSYFWYCGLKLDQRDIHQNLKFAQILYMNSIPITYEQIQKIFDVSTAEFQFQLLALISSGMRISELGKIKNAHLNVVGDNYAVHIPAEVTKTGRARVTFFSKQISDRLRERTNIKDTDYVLNTDRSSEQFVNLILKRFSSSRKKAGLIQLHEHCRQNRYHIHVHGLRSYFITNLNKIQFGVGHILAGHDFYMKGYNQYTLDELLAAYKQTEKHLTFRG